MREELRRDEALMHGGGSLLGKRQHEDDDLPTQGVAAVPLPMVWNDDEGDDEFNATQGVAASPRPMRVSEPAEDESEPSATQGEVAAPRVSLLTASWAQRAIPPHESVRVAFTGVRDLHELRRLHSIVDRLGGTLEEPHTLSSSVTHLVIAPAVGQTTTAKSVWAALTKKTLVSPGWLDASARLGGFVALAPGPTGATSVVDALTRTSEQRGAPQSAMADGTPIGNLVHSSPQRGEEHGGTSTDAVALAGAAVRGIANPLDGTRVHVTECFKQEHANDKVVNALLTARPVLLKEALMCDAAAAELVLAGTDEHVEATGPCVLTWSTFLERLVPGHAARKA